MLRLGLGSNVLPKIGGYESTIPKSRGLRAFSDIREPVSHERVTLENNSAKSVRHQTQKSSDPPPLKFVGIEGIPVKIPLSDTVCESHKS